MDRPWLEMLMLLVPEPAIDIAALEQLVVPSGVVNPAALQHQYHVGGYQHRQAVRNDHEGAAFGDAQKVGVDDRLAFRVERARRFVEDQDARIADQCASGWWSLLVCRSHSRAADAR